MFPLDKKAACPVFRVRITNEHITQAEKRNGHKCMIAEAIMESYRGGEASFVRVDLQSIRFTDLEKGLRYYYFTPKRAQKALLNFDQGKHVEPFSFELREAQVRRSGWHPTVQAKAAHRERERAKGSRPKRAPINPRQEPAPRKFGLCRLEP